MTKIRLVLILGIMIIALSGCGNNTSKQEVKYENYEARYVNNYDCSLDDVYDVNSYYNYFVSNDFKVFYISDKKNTETENHCTYIFRNENNYKYLGYMDTYSNGVFFLFVDNNNKVIGIDKDGKVNNIYKKYSDVDKLYKTKNIKYYYFYERSVNSEEYYFNDKTIFYHISSDYSHEVAIPEGETILYHGFHDKKQESYKYEYGSEIHRLMIITDKGRYNPGVADDDKCNEYNDVKCTYKLVETSMYDYVFKNYNVKYFDGQKLITKGGNLYSIKDLR